MADPYEVLGIERTATLAEAEAAYRARLHEVHPDRHPGGDAIDQQERARQTQALTEAIRDLRLRLREVRELQRCPSCGAPLHDPTRLCPVCRADPNVPPWWHDAPDGDAGEIVHAPSGSRERWARDQWSVTPVASNASGVIVWGLLLLVVIVVLALIIDGAVVERLVR